MIYELHSVFVKSCQKIDQIKEQIELVEVGKKLGSIEKLIGNVNQNATWSNADFKNPLNEAIRMNELIVQRSERLKQFPTKIRVLSQDKDSVKAANENLFLNIKNFTEKTNEIGDKISNVSRRKASVFSFVV
jgi:hypothetical protein